MAYHTIEEIEARREELRDELSKSNEQMSNLWASLTATHRPNTRGELITSIISKSITAFDAFMLGRKLFMQYKHLFRRKRR